jgi:hypothetical protein
MIFQDRSLAGTASRFSTLLSWIFPMPHYWRLSGTAMIIPDVRDFSALEVVHEIVGHLGGPLTEPEMRRWLAEHFLEFDAAKLAVAHLRRRQMLVGMDAKFGKSVYELRATFAQCRNAWMGCRMWSMTTSLKRNKKRVLSRRAPGLINLRK